MDFSKQLCFFSVVRSLYSLVLRAYLVLDQRPRRFLVVLRARRSHVLLLHVAHDFNYQN